MNEFAIIRKNDSLHVMKENGTEVNYYRYFSTTSCRGVPERRFRSDIRHTHDKCR